MGESRDSRRCSYCCAPAAAAAGPGGCLDGRRGLVGGVTGSSVAKSELGLRTGDAAVVKPPWSMVA